MEVFSLLWWHWCVAGLILVMLELLVPGVFLLWIGVGAITTSVIAGGFGITNWQIQCLVFIPLCFASLYLGRKYIRQARPSENSTLNRRLASYVGRTAEVAQPIVNGKGRIRLGDTLWIARGKDCPAGTKVIVTGIDGSDLVVTAENSPKEVAPDSDNG